MNNSINGTNKFSVLFFSDLTNQHQFEISIRTFLRFYHDLTPKHKKKISFYAINATTSQQQILTQQNKRLEAEGLESAIFYSKSPDEFTEQVPALSVILHPNETVTESTRIALLSHCLPILTFDTWEKAWSFDVASILYVSEKMKDSATKEFANLIKMLYFDLGATKMLVEKAKKHRRATTNR